MLQVQSILFLDIWRVKIAVNDCYLAVALLSRPSRYGSVLVVILVGCDGLLVYA